MTGAGRRIKTWFGAKAKVEEDEPELARVIAAPLELGVYQKMGPNDEGETP